MFAPIFIGAFVIKRIDQPTNSAVPQSMQGSSVSFGAFEE